MLTPTAVQRTATTLGCLAALNACRARFMMVSTEAAASPFVLMETLFSSRKSTFASVASILALLLVLYVASYCWLRFGMAETWEMTLPPELPTLCLRHKRWEGIEHRLNFIFKPLLKFDALISEKDSVRFLKDLD